MKHSDAISILAIAISVLALCLGPCAPARAGDHTEGAGTITAVAVGTSNAVTITPSDRSLFSLFVDHEPVLVVKPDGTVWVRGVAVENMNTEEAKQAWRDVSIWVARQYQGTTLTDSLNRQTEYLLLQLEACRARCDGVTP